MILRRGVGDLVPAGTPYFPHERPLVPTIIQTVEGRAREGGRFGVTSVPLSGLAGLVAAVHARRGMGDVQYCSSNPPSASQAAYLGQQGISYSIVECGGTPTPQGTNQGNQPVSGILNTNVAPSSAPVYQAPTDIEDCVALGLGTSAGQACVARNTQRAVNAENAHLSDNQQYQTQLCIANGGGGYVPAGQDVGSWCAGQYGGSVPATYAPMVSSGPSGVVTASGAAPAVPAATAATFSFQNLTSGNVSQFNVGDKWQISISGTQPNMPVWVVGGKNGASSGTQMGQTNGSGAFSLSGQMTADQVGTWQEAWSVGNPAVAPAQNVGFLAFSVLAPPATKTIDTTGGGGSTGGGGTSTTTTTTNATGTFDIGSFLTESVFMGIPNWILIAGAGAIFLFMSGGHK